MLVAKIDNNEVVQIADYREIFSQVSFPATGMSDGFLAENGCLPVTVWKPYDSLTQKLESTTPYIEGGQVYTVQVVDKTQEELDADTQSKAIKVRAARNQLLTESDWTQVLDAPVNKQAWSEYRQALRDITTQPAFPWEIIWPIKPMEEV